MKVLLVDDHPLFLDGLNNLMTVYGIEVVGTARDGLEALEKARALHPEVILMDVQMPGLNGIEAARLIKTEHPDVKIVMLSVSETDEDIFEAIRNGASGYLLKTVDKDKFFELLSGLERGEAALSPGLADRLLIEFFRKGAGADGSVKPEVEQKEVLTPRQIEVLSLVAQGLAYKEVGARLFVSERTIKYHMGEIIQKLHLKNRLQAIDYARHMKIEEE